MVRLNFLDILLLIFFIYHGYRGFKAGLINSIAPLVYWFVAFFVSVKYMDVVGAKFTQYLGFNGQIAPVIGFVFLLVAAIMISRFVTGKMHGAFNKDKSKLTKPNMYLGMIFGTLKSILIASVALLIMAQLNIPKYELRNTSILYDDVSRFVYTVWDRASVVWPNAEALAEKFKIDLQRELRQETPSKPETPAKLETPAKSVTPAKANK